MSVRMEIFTIALQTLFALICKAHIHAVARKISQTYQATPFTQVVYAQPN